MTSPHLQPLDLDELEPLPPSRIDTRSDSSCRHPLDDDGPAGRTFTSPTLSPDQQSPQWSAESSPEQRRIPLPRQPLSIGTSFGTSLRATESVATPQAEKHDSSSASQRLPLGSSSAPTKARYLTVSSVLSRSGVARTWNEGEALHHNQINRQHVARNAERSSRWKATAGRRASNGSALEAVGALLLHRDSTGTVSNLSFARAPPRQNDGSSRPGLISRASRAWMQGLRQSGERAATWLGIKPTAFIRSSLSVYGRGSAWGIQEALEAPPSPIDMPGAWSGGSSAWRARPGDGYEEGALLLPPPLLDDRGSDARSFEGLLGVRRAREREKALKEFERLKARNRPAHKVGLLTAFSNFNQHMSARAPTTPLQQDDGRRLHGLYESGTLPDEARFSRGRAAQRRERSLGSTGSSEFADESLSDAELSSSFSGQPRAPRLLPVHLGSPVAALTPMVLDSQPNTRVGSRRTSVGSTASADYMTRGVQVRAKGSLPVTPKLGPTLLSLPPSPWTPLAKSPAMSPFLSTQAAPSYVVQLGTSATPRTKPGTPRLEPTHIEILPSPFPQSSLDSAAFRLSPSTSEFEHSLEDPFEDKASSTSPALHPSVRSEQPSTPSAVPRRRKNTNPRATNMNPASRTASARLTPSDMIAAWTSDLHSTSTPNGTSKAPGQLPTSSSDYEGPTIADLERRAVEVPGRSWLLWFLIGDLGLGDRSSMSISKGYPDRAGGTAAAAVTMERFGGVPTLLGHCFDFIVYLLAHVIDLAYRIGEVMILAAWFLRWLFLNLTGQTVLSRCVVEAYKLIQAEWATVAAEDHEAKGMKKSRRGSVVDVTGSTDAHQQPKGLTRWQIVRGIVELVCLYTVTRQRYLEEGAGLVKLEGWQKTNLQRRDTPKAADDVSQATQANNSPTPSAVSSKGEYDAPALPEATSDKDSDADQHSSDSAESDNESDDDDFVVTRQGAEILEFQKTPRLEPRLGHGEQSSSAGDGSKGPGSYFLSTPGGAGSSTDRTRRNKYERKERGQRPRDVRAMVRNIKWASRLAISAYGLHVTLVDLPATFTPSGNRFSRQTFAHLSRIRSDDVLHADIQTLDSDTYHPTFYLVRDYARRCVCVSVRGTQSLQDIIIDLEMATTKLQLPGVPSVGADDPDEELTCHSGILRAAKALLEPDSSLFSTLSSALAENEGFDLVLTGHSLGGAIASTVALLLSEYRVLPGQAADEGQWVVRPDSGLPAGRSVRALTFAHPATVSAALAERASRGLTPLVTTVVLGSDLIPRCGHGQAREVRRLLGALSRVRRRHEHKRADDVEDARIHILHSWWAWSSIQKAGRDASNEMRERAKRIEDQLWRLRCDVEQDLYAEIKKRSAKHNEGLKSASKAPPSPWIGPQQRSSAPLHQLAARRQALDAATLRSEAAQGGILIPPGRSIWINGKDL
ncbi:Predicted lipase/calmodulin-binding heat-shock protein [Ceraceosorus bombacis]|uniref:sn-1-specific diacylglycerol lipase n=1 Tax=Ceraceosorus bombacis TaxID=401625 RepID=A0A0P1BB59_9BASI|nr:Predicted lipase/calmodulin-binding heat-shock protein [Ceraceosorus bombacis]